VLDDWAGVSAEKRQKGRTLKPIIEFSHDGDKYKVTGSAEGIPERTKEFVLDVEQEETTIDGRKVKVLINSYYVCCIQLPWRFVISSFQF
jgi:hypothetical protein